MVLTAGTFLRGIMHMGDRQTPEAGLGRPPQSVWPEPSADWGCRSDA